MGMTIDNLKKECQYCCREIDSSGLEGFRCMNKIIDSSWCYPKNANEPCSMCDYCKPAGDGTTKEEAWVRIYELYHKTYGGRGYQWELGGFIVNLICDCEGFTLNKNNAYTLLGFPFKTNNDDLWVIKLWKEIK